MKNENKIVVYSKYPRNGEKFDEIKYFKFIPKTCSFFEF